MRSGGVAPTGPLRQLPATALNMPADARDGIWYEAALEPSEAHVIMPYMDPGEEHGGAPPSPELQVRLTAFPSPPTQLFQVVCLRRSSQWCPPPPHPPSPLPVHPPPHPPPRYLQLCVTVYSDVPHTLGGTPAIGGGEVAVVPGGGAPGADDGWKCETCANAFPRRACPFDVVFNKMVRLEEIMDHRLALMDQVLARSG